MSFTNRIFLSLGLLALAMTFSAHGLYQNHLESSILKEIKGAGFKQLELIDELLGQRSSILRERSLQDRLVNLGKTLNVRLTYVDSNGRVLADSGMSRSAIASMEDHSSRPEILEAKEAGRGFSLRYSTTQHIEFLYLAKPVDLPGLQPGYLRLAKPHTQIEEALAGTTWRFAAVLLIALLLALTLGWLLSRRLGSEISHISAAAESIGSDRQASRIDFLPLREFVPFVRSINRLSKKAQKDYRIIAEHRDELEAILDGMQEGVLLLNRRGGVEKANKAAKAICSVSFGITGRKPIELIRCPELQSAVERMLKTRSRETERLLVSLPDQRFFDTSIIPVSLTREAEPEMIVVLHDVSELKRLEQVRKDFVANISHELRTPLTSIKGYTETLLSSPLPDQSTLTSFMQVIQKNVNTMTHLLENLLQLARLESEPQKTSNEPVEAKTAFSVAWEICAPLAADKDIQLSNELPPGEIQVLAKHEQLVRVWINLLDNAVKYSPKQGTIRVWAEEEEQSWVFCVQDEGPGIPRKDQDRIFERFYRVESSRNGRDIPGTGLGLAICKHILQRHGGTIQVSSPVPETLQGSIFSFRLPKQQRDRTPS